MHTHVPSTLPFIALSMATVSFSIVTQPEQASYTIRTYSLEMSVHTLYLWLLWKRWGCRLSRWCWAGSLIQWLILSPQELCDVLLDDRHCNSSKSHDWNMSGVSHVQNEPCVVKQCSNSVPTFDYTTFQQSYIYNYIFIPTWMNSNRELNRLHRWLWAQNCLSLPAVSKNLSSVKCTRPNLPAVFFSSTLGSFCVDPGYICYPNILLYHWSFMRARVGVSTTVIFVMRGGNCKYKLLPEPVGCSTKCVLYGQCSLYYHDLPVLKKQSSKAASPESLSYIVVSVSRTPVP